MFDGSIGSLVALGCGFAFVLLTGQILMIGNARPIVRLLGIVPPLLTLARVLLPAFDVTPLIKVTVEGAHIAAWAAVPVAFRLKAEAGRSLAWSLSMWGPLTLVILGAPFFDLEGLPALAEICAVIAVLVLGLVELEQIVRRAESEQFWIIKHGALGLGALLGFNLFLYAESLLLGRINPHLVTVRAIAYALCVPLVMASIARLQGYRREIRLSQKGTYQSVLISLVGLYFLIMALFGYLIRALGTRWDSEIEVIFIFGALLLLPLLFGSAALRAKLKVMISKNFFTYRYDYREEWLRFVRTVSQQANQGDLKLRIVKAIANIAEATGGAMWLLNEEDRAYLLVETWNMGADRMPAIAQDASLPSFLGRTGWIVDLSEHKAGRMVHEGLELPPWLTEHECAWVILPLFNRDQLTGFVLLGAPRVKRALQWEDFDILKTVGRHAAAYLTEESILRDLSDARRLEAFNRRFAFVIHDIKNIVGQMSLMVRNADRFGGDPEFQKDMMVTVSNAVERLTHLMQQIRTETAAVNGAAPQVPGIGLAEEATPAERSDHALAAILAAVAQRWQIQEPRFSAKLSGAEGIRVSALPADLSSVLDHLIQNAVEAIGANGRIALSAVAAERDAVISVQDDGPGIDPEFVRDKLFRPLVSGKSEGFGLGAFQCREMVRSMGGRIDIDSIPGKGTRIDVVLPRRLENDQSLMARTAMP